MLQQQTAAHTRGALSILGHVHFRNGSHVQVRHGFGVSVCVCVCVCVCVKSGLLPLGIVQVQ
jgi:hypothetical protein